MEDIVRVAGGPTPLLCHDGVPRGADSRHLHLPELVPRPWRPFPSEQEAIAREARTAPVVVVPAAPMLDSLGREEWLRPALVGHTVAFQGKLLTVPVKGAPVPSPTAPSAATSSPPVL